MNQSEQENPDQVANKSNGLVTIPRIPDPFILSRIASLPSAAMESSSNTLKPRLLPVDTQSIDAFNTFTKFPQLPLEVQRMVWKEALPGPKTLLIKPSLRAGRHIMWFLRGDFSTYESNYKLPNEILVSKVALEMVSKNSLVMRNHLICKNTPGQCFQSKFVFDFNIDAVYIDLKGLPHSFSPHLPVIIMHGLWSGMNYGKKVVHLALPGPEPFCGFEYYLSGLVTNHPNMRHLTFIMEDETQNQPGSERDLVFEDPIDVDYALNLFMHDPREVECEKIPKHPSFDQHLEDMGVAVAFTCSLDVPNDLVIDFKIAIHRQKAEELARRKKRFYALKELIAQGEDVPWRTSSGAGWKQITGIREVDDQLGDSA